MKYLIAWLRKIWVGPVPPEYWQALDRFDDGEYVVELWRGEDGEEK